MLDLLCLISARDGILPHIHLYDYHSTVIASDSKGLKFNLSRSFNEKDGRRCCRDSGRRFDVQTLPVDLHRVYKHLYEQTQDEQYALTIVFMIRTAVELHRAWHMTLLTSKLLQQLKHTFQLRMTWNLGVTDVSFSSVFMFVCLGGEGRGDWFCIFVGSIIQHRNSDHPFQFFFILIL